MNNNYQSHTPQMNDDQSGDDIKKTIFQYLRYWPWFVLSVIITLSIAFIYVRYSPMIYKTNSKIKVLKSKKDSI